MCHSLRLASSTICRARPCELHGPPFHQRRGAPFDFAALYFSSFPPDENLPTFRLGGYAICLVPCITNTNSNETQFVQPSGGGSEDGGSALAYFRL